MSTAAPLPPGLVRQIDARRAYSTTQLARVLGVSPKSVMRWRTKGLHPGGDDRLPRVKLAGGWYGAWRYHGADVLEFLAAVAPADPAGDVAAAAVRPRRDGVDDQLDQLGL